MCLEPSTGNGLQGGILPPWQLDGTPHGPGGPACLLPRLGLQMLPNVPGDDTKGQVRREMPGTSCRGVTHTRLCKDASGHCGLP